jgi:hypothetical protein
MQWSHLSIFEAALYVHAWVAVHEKENEGFRRELPSSTEGALSNGRRLFECTPCICAHLKAADVLAAGLVIASEQVVLPVAFIIQAAEVRRHVEFAAGSRQPGIVNGGPGGGSYACSACTIPPRVPRFLAEGTRVRCECTQKQSEY